MTCAAPKGTPPRRFNYLKTPRLTSQEPVTDASRTFTIFHGLGANHSRSYPFQQSHKLVNHNRSALKKCPGILKFLIFCAISFDLIDSLTQNVPENQLDVI